MKSIKAYIVTLLIALGVTATPMASNMLGGTISGATQWRITGTVLAPANSSATLKIPAYNCTGNTNSGKLTAGADGTISCADDISGGGGPSSSVWKGLMVREGSAAFTHIGSMSFDAGKFTLTNTASLSAINLDWGLGGPASLSEAETILGNWVNTANPWADNEVVDALTVTGGVIGANSISGTQTTTGTLTIGDNGDSIIFDASNWDISTLGKADFLSASVSTNFEAVGYSSASKRFGSGLGACASQKALQWATTGLFGCSGDFQSQDATLTALAAYNTNGILTQTAADTFTGRTITGTTDQITVANGDGVSNNPTLSIPTPFIIPGRASVSGNFEVYGIASISSSLRVAGATTLIGNLIGANASFSAGEFTSVASASAFRGSAFPSTNCTGSTFLQWSTTGLFTCGTPASAYTWLGFDFSTIGASQVKITSISFDANSFVLSNTASQGNVRINWGASGVASRSAANTWTGLNTFNASALALQVTGNASISANFEVRGLASVSKQFGAGLSACSGNNHLQWSTTGLFSCTADGATVFQPTILGVKDIPGLYKATVASVQFNGDTFTLSASGSSAFVKVDWGLNGIASRAANEAITGSWEFRNKASASPQFSVGGFTVLGNSIAQFATNSNNFAQVNIQNFSNGASASSDLALTANDGGNTNRYLNLGINSSLFKFAKESLTGAHDSYIIASNSNLAIFVASQSSTAGIKFGVGGTPIIANTKFSIFSVGASFSIPLEVSAYSSASQFFGGIASHQFSGSLSGRTTGTLSVGASNNPLKILWSNIVKAVTQFFFPTTTSTVPAIAGEAIVNTASASLEVYTGAANKILDAEICRTFVVDSPTAANPSRVGPVRFNDPFTITSVQPVASGSNAAGWNLQYGAPGAITTNVFTLSKSASTSSYPTYLSFANSALTDGQALVLNITSRSAALQTFSVTVCGRKTK